MYFEVVGFRKQFVLPMFQHVPKPCVVLGVGPQEDEESRMKLKLDPMADHSGILFYPAVFWESKLGASLESDSSKILKGFSDSTFPLVVVLPL